MGYILAWTLPGWIKNGNMACLCPCMTRCSQRKTYVSFSMLMCNCKGWTQVCSVDVQQQWLGTGVFCRYATAMAGHRCVLSICNSNGWAQVCSVDMQQQWLDTGVFCRYATAMAGHRCVLSICNSNGWTQVCSVDMQQQWLGTGVMSIGVTSQ